MLPLINTSSSLKILLFIVIINRAFALNCHVCTTLGTSNCLDDFIESQSSECEGENKCVKYKTYALLHDAGSVWSESTKVSAVTRGCLQSNEEDSCTRTVIHGGYHVRCVCSNDDCNDATTKSASFFVLIVCIVTLLFQFLI